MANGLARLKLALWTEQQDEALAVFNALRFLGSLVLVKWRG